MGPLRPETLTWLLHAVRQREAAEFWRDGVLAWINKATRGRMPWLPESFRISPMPGRWRKRTSRWRH